MVMRGTANPIDVSSILTLTFRPRAGRGWRVVDPEGKPRDPGRESGGFAAGEGSAQ